MWHDAGAHLLKPTDVAAMVLFYLMFVCHNEAALSALHFAGVLIV